MNYIIINNLLSKSKDILTLCYCYLLSAAYSIRHSIIFQPGASFLYFLNNFTSLVPTFGRLFLKSKRMDCAFNVIIILLGGWWHVALIEIDLLFSRNQFLILFGAHFACKLFIIIKMKVFICFSIKSYYKIIFGTIFYNFIFV